MYAAGLPIFRISLLCSAKYETVRAHLRTMTTLQTNLEADHQKNRPDERPISESWIARLHELKNFRQRHGRNPLSKEKPSLATWLIRQRHEEKTGAPDRTKARLLQELGDWQSTARQVLDSAEAQSNIDDVGAFFEAHHDYPRVNATGGGFERTLALWLRSQRIKLRAGELNAGIKRELDKVIPGWPEPRPSNLRRTISRRSMRR